jgi:hypothetical protein
MATNGTNGHSYKGSNAQDNARVHNGDVVAVSVEIGNKNLMTKSVSPRLCLFATRKILLP